MKTATDAAGNVRAAVDPGTAAQIDAEIAKINSVRQPGTRRSTPSFKAGSARCRASSASRVSTLASGPRSTGNCRVRRRRETPT